MTTTANPVLTLALAELDALEAKAAAIVDYLDLIGRVLGELSAALAETQRSFPHAPLK